MTSIPTNSSWLLVLAFIGTQLLACAEPPLQEGYTEQGGYYVVFETNPAPVVFKEYFDVTVGVYESDKQEILLDTLDVLVDSTMPEHQHGMNETPTQSVNTNGETVATGLQWFMTGTWQMEFYITDTDGDGSTETALFSMECCEQ